MLFSMWLIVKTLKKIQQQTKLLNVLFLQLKKKYKTQTQNSITNLQKQKKKKCKN